MNIISTVLDSNYGPIQMGENGHVEKSWSYDVNEQICQFFFQLVRTKDTSDLQHKLDSMLKNLTWTDNLFQLLTLLKIMVHTRDVIDGKGEYDLAFMQLLVWYKYYPKIAFECFQLFLDTDKNPLDHQYGSWKDVKRFCQYIKDNTIDGEKHPLISGIISISLEHMKDEYTKSKNDINYKPTLVGKWLPREKSKYGWIFNRLADMMNPVFMVTATDRSSMNKASRKQKMELKKILVYLNKRVETVQVKMCDREWSSIDFNNVTSLTMSKNKNAILYVDKKGEIRGDNSDRIACKENYKAHLSAVKNGDTTKKIHGKRCQVGELVRDALSCQIMEKSYGDLMETINEQWKSNLTNNKGLEGKSIVTMCDLSGSMECDNSLPLHNAIGLCIRISELVDDDSGFKNRILTFDSHPTWVQLTDEQSFVEKAHIVKNAGWGTSTNFHLALDKIIDVLVEKEIHPLIVEKLIFAVFGDMQIGCSDHNIFDTMGESIKHKFVDAGMKTKWKQPYEMPHILFWNLKKTSGFPTTSYSKNITFLSGYSSTLLNVFCTKGIDALRESTPATMLRDLLNTDRYNIVYDIINL